MSYTTIKAIWPGEKHQDIEELRNGHGSAPVIWGALAERYLGQGRYSWLVEDRDASAIFGLYKSPRVPASLRAVLAMTFDRAYVEKKDYKAAARDIREFLRIAPAPADHVNHWPRIADLFDSDPDYPAIGLHCTSVSEDPFQGPWNEEKEDYDPPDWTQCYSVYDIPEIASAQTEFRDAIERGARVLCKRCGVDPDDLSGGTWDGGSYPAGKPAWQSWADDARAVVEAIQGRAA
jgi:hypothetical protein